MRKSGVEIMPDTSKETSQPQEAPITQERRGFREGWPVWLRQMPRLKFPPMSEDFQLIAPDKLEAFLQTVDAEAAERIRSDIKHMEYELLRLFRRRDYEAKLHQNRYRLYQLGYTALATLAMLIGSVLALSLNSWPAMVPWLAFAETVVALMTTFLATISGREPPQTLWLTNRRRAEYLRREYFRYLMNLSPYDAVRGYEREMLLSRRAADINRGSRPGDEEGR
jgi:hypothetical protein